MSPTLRSESATFPPPGVSIWSGSVTTEPLSFRSTASSANTFTRSMRVTSAPTLAASTTSPCTRAPSIAIAIRSSTLGVSRRTARYASWKRATLSTTHTQPSHVATLWYPNALNASNATNRAICALFVPSLTSSLTLKLLPTVSTKALS